MVFVENQTKFELPRYFQGKYKNNLNMRVPRMYLGNPLSMMMGGYQTISNGSQTYRSYSEGKDRLQIADGLFQTSMSIVSFFARPFGMLVSTGSGLALNCFQVNEAWQKKDSAKPRETGLQILHSLGLLLSMRFSGNRGRAIFSSLRQMQRPMVHALYQDDSKTVVSDIKTRFFWQKKAGDDS